MRALALLALAAAAGAAGDPLPPAAALGEHAAAMRLVVDRATVRERVGPVDTPLSLAVSDFLLDHPDMSAWLVRRHGLAPYVIEMRGPGRSWADDGDGTAGFVDLAFRSSGRRAYYTEGTHKSRVFPDIRASAVIVMDVRPEETPACGPRVTSSFDVSVRLRSRFLSGVVAALKPFIRGVIVRKFTRAFDVARQVGVLLAREPEATRRELLSFPGLSAEDRAAGEKLLSGLAPAPTACLSGPAAR